MKWHNKTYFTIFELNRFVLDCRAERKSHSIISDRCVLRDEDTVSDN